MNENCDCDSAFGKTPILKAEITLHDSNDTIIMDDFRGFGSSSGYQPKLFLREKPDTLVESWDELPFKSITTLEILDREVVEIEEPFGDGETRTTQYQKIKITSALSGVEIITFMKVAHNQLYGLNLRTGSDRFVLFKDVKKIEFSLEEPTRCPLCGQKISR